MRAWAGAGNAFVPWRRSAHAERGQHRAARLDYLGAVLATVSVVWWAGVVMFEPRGGERSGSPASGAPGADLATEPAAVVSGYVGYPYTHRSDLKFVQPGATDLTVHDVEWEGRPFKSPIYYGLRVTRWRGGLSPFGHMLDFTHSKAIARPAQTVRFSGTRNGRAFPESATVSATFKHLEFSHGHNMLTGNGLMRLGSLSRQLSPYVGAGVGVNLPHTEIQFIGDTERTYEYQYTGPTGQVLLGIEMRLPRVVLFVEYKLTVSLYDAPLTGRDNKASFGYSDFLLQLAAWWRGEKPKYGSVRTWLVSHQAIGGAGPRWAGTGAAPR